MEYGLRKRVRTPYALWDLESRISNLKKGQRVPSMYVLYVGLTPTLAVKTNNKHPVRGALRVRVRARALRSLRSGSGSRAFRY